MSEPTTHRVLITGASGMIGTLLRPRLASDNRVLRLLDINPPAPPQSGERVEVLTGSITDTELMTKACQGMDAVLHLGGYSGENTWAEILEINVHGTQVVLEAAAAVGVPRVILASSNHAVGFRGIDEDGPDGVRADSTARPDTYYGFSKAAVEALGSLYHSRFGMDVICLRIGSCFPRPRNARALGIWLSPDDAARLFEACLTVPNPGYRVIWGASANTRGVYSMREAAEIGYQPRDDAEVFAKEILAARHAMENPPGQRYLGGHFTAMPLGVPHPR